MDVYWKDCIARITRFEDFPSQVSELLYIAGKDERLKWDLLILMRQRGGPDKELWNQFHGDQLKAIGGTVAHA